jgi:hypothetical protein
VPKDTPKRYTMSTKQVNFDTIEIIELPMTLGDNPSVSVGAPLTVEWESQQRTTFQLDFFEKYRPERRSRRTLVISPEARQQILLQHGFCLEDILAASWEASCSLDKPSRPKLVKKRMLRRISDLSSRQRQAVRKLQELNQSIFSISKDGTSDCCVTK